MNKFLKDYLSIIVPPKLEEDEYIRIFMQSTIMRTGQRYCTNKFVKTFEEVDALIKKYRYNYDIFIALSTSLGTEKISAQTSYRRQVIFLDFDQKAYPEYKDARDFSKHIKERIPELFNHCIVSSGSGGCHFYIACECSENSAVVRINKTLAELLGADIKAVTSTQIARIPTTFNLKYGERNPVRVISNTYGTAKFIPYPLSKLSGIIRRYSKNIVIDKELQKTPSKITMDCKYVCVQKMLSQGCPKGHRNFALGRITCFLRTQRYLKENALKRVLAWNRICSPPKQEREVISDFNRYWDNRNYRLLGCNLPDIREKRILDMYCDKTMCITYHVSENAGDGKEPLLINEKLFNRTNIKRLDGVHYAIVLILHDNQFDFNELFTILNKNCNSLISQKTLRKKLSALEEYKIIEKCLNKYKLKKIRSEYFTNIRINAVILDKFINKDITKTELKVYLAMNYKLQTKNNATLSTLSEFLDIDKSSVSRYIHNLNDKELIKIEKVYTENGLYYNRYSFI